MLKKLFLALVLLLALTALGVYFAGGWLLGAATRAALPQAVGLAERAGLQVQRCDFANASIRPPAALRWNDWQIEFTRRPAGTAEATTPLHLRLGRVQVDCTDWSPLSARLVVDGAVLDTPFVPAGPSDLPFGGDEFGVAIERIDDGFLRLPHLEPGTAPRAALARAAADLQQLVQTGATPRELEVGARLHFRLKGSPLAVRLETERRHGTTRLRFNAADIAELSRRYNRPLTAGEQRILCEHPQRALLLLRIKEYAEHLSQRLARVDRAYGEDFTRHVVWSYWLTRAFGPEFAQQVTDVHEEATDNTAAEHRQDFANNLVGRTYALARKTEGQMLQLLKTDPMVVRSAR